MNNWKGTKGGWEIGSDLKSILTDKGAYRPNAINTVNCSEQELKANAKLIAAAPDLLEALMSIENDKGIIPKTIWDMRNKAIEKALK